MYSKVKVVKYSVFLTSALDGGDWSASIPFHLTLAIRSPSCNQYTNQHMYLTQYYSWQEWNSYMFWHQGAILWESSTTKEYKFNMLT